MTPDPEDVQPRAAQALSDAEYDALLLGAVLDAMEDVRWIASGVGEPGAGSRAGRTPDKER